MYIAGASQLHTEVTRAVINFLLRIKLSIKTPESYLVIKDLYI